MDIVKRLGYTGTGSGSGSVAYYASISSGTWTLSGSTYYIIIPFASHLKINPVVTAYELSGTDYVEVELSIIVDSSNNVTVQISSTPDLRFTGKLIIS